MANMKVRELKMVSPDQTGHIERNGVKTEPNEESTFKYLIRFGFDIELIRPTKVGRVKSPDSLIMGTPWEVKTPVSANQSTIKNRFRGASKQAAKVVFDLRFIRGDADKVEKQVVALFQASGRVRRMLLIEKCGKLLDFYK